MKTNTILNILRNPYGRSEEEKRNARLEAANEIESWIDAYNNMKEWAIKNGLDINTYNKSFNRNADKTPASG